jgi:hypothetical protein
MTTEADLMHQCRGLYGTIAIEAVAGLAMGMMFMYLWMRVCTRDQLKSPAAACWKLVCYSYNSSWNDFTHHMSKWADMPNLSMGERFMFCRKANQAILLFQAGCAFFSVTRILHIGNVNGMRYLGYAITCPPMQAELIVLIAPVVPCYKLAVVFTYLLTFTQLIIGWCASVNDTHLLNCDLDMLMSWDDACFDYSPKFKIILPAICNQLFLSFCQIPLLGMLYKCNGGGSNRLLPPDYLKLLAIVSLTWLGFPAWWFLSYEGMGVLTDTKLNAVGFVLLNLLSKGMLSFQVLNMVTQHRARGGGEQRSARELGACRPRSGSTESLDLDGPSDGWERQRSSDSKDEVMKGDGPEEVKAALSVQAWLVRFLRNFDDGAPATPLAVNCMPPEPMQYGHKMGKERHDEKDPDFEAGHWARQKSGDSQISTALVSSSERGEHHGPSPNQMWDQLEPMYRRFLRDAGISQIDFLTMPSFDKVDLRSKFDKVASAVLVGQKSRGVPQWAALSSVSLADATDEQILKEMRRRLAGSVSHGNGDNGRQQDRFRAMENDQLDIEAEVDSYANSPRRGYQV